MTAPRPTPETPLYPYEDSLADADGYLYHSTGRAVILDGKHATIEAEADEYATRPLSEFTTYAGKDNPATAPESPHQYRHSDPMETCSPTLTGTSTTSTAAP